MNETEELRAVLDELRKKVRQDLNVPGTLHDEFVLASKELEEALENLEQTKQMDVDKVRFLYENAQRLSLMLEDIKRGRSGYPSYIDDFVPSIANAPYTMPRTLFEPQGAQQISTNVEGQMKVERAELALGVLFPGSTTYRYGASPVKIRLGRLSESGRAHLSSIHELSPKPEFELRVGDRIFHVYKPLTLKAFRLHGRCPICTTCLSLIDDDETCGHRTLQPHAKLPSSYPIVRKLELSRTSTDTKSLQRPLSLIVPQATFLSELEVGLAVMGFERTATVRGNSRTMRVEYDPPIGIRLSTSGLSFRVNIPEEFLLKTLDANPMLRRDMILQLLANTIADIIGEIGLPSYHHELLLSSVISAIHLDDLIDEKTATDRLRDSNFIPQANGAIDHELSFYESTRPDANLVLRVLASLQTLDITKSSLHVKLKETILHSLAHVLLLAAAVTSGSQLDDLDYLLKEDSDEVVIFDAVSGGNGSSETAFEFLSEAGTFNLEEYLGSEEREELYKPRNFDETAFEFLLPCLNGVSDRIFLFGMVEPFENEIKRKLCELKGKSTTHGASITRIRAYGSSRMYPISIGYHGMDYSTFPHEADRFKEVAGICLHGCPECISIGRKCHLGSFYEKYNISKFALDELLNHTLQTATLVGPSRDQIRDTLKEQGFAVIKGSCANERACQEIVKNLNVRILELVGQEVENGHIKFAGHWVNANFSFGDLDYYYMLKVI